MNTLTNARSNKEYNVRNRNFLIMTKGTVHVIKGRIGHANALTTLNVYAHLLPQHDSQASTVIGYALDQAIQNAKNVVSKESNLSAES